MPFKIIGIAGYMGSGKSTLARAWAEKFDAEIVDADLVAKKLMCEDTQIIAALQNRFHDVSDDSIDFKTLGSLVFSDKKNLEDLNRIVHPPLIQKINMLSSKISQDVTVVIDAALLTLWSGKIKFDHAIWVNASVEQRIVRFCKRTGLSAEIAAERVESQLELFSPPGKHEKCWSFIDNDQQLDTAVTLGNQLISGVIS